MKRFEQYNNFFLEDKSAEEQAMEMVIAKYDSGEITDITNLEDMRRVFVNWLYEDVD